MPNLRDALTVMTFELREGIRSRKTLVLLFLFVAGAAGGAAMFVNLVEHLKKSIEEQTRRAAGQVVTSLTESPQFREAVTELIGDADVAAAILQTPIIALFYGSLAITFTPLFVILSSTDSISGELSAGSSRFALFRVDRLSWALGKLGGQSLILVVGLALGGLAAWTVGAIWYEDMELLPSLWWVERMAGRVWFYGLAYLGVAIGVSQLTRSVYIAIGLGLLALFALGITGAILDSQWMHAKLGTVDDVLLWFLPKGHIVDLWHPSMFTRAGAYGALTLIGLATFGMGHVVFARRDV